MNNLRRKFSSSKAAALAAVLGLSITMLLPGCGGGAADQTGTPSAAALAAKLGRPARLLIGLGSTKLADIQSQHINVDFFDHYLVGVGDSSWPSWNSPRGAYVSDFAASADAIGAVPMFTLYQMASNGDGDLSGINDSAFMTQYWSNVSLLFQKLAAYDKPAVINLEPDFWGYVEQYAPNGDPAQMPARVTINPDCAGLPNNVTGIAACLLHSARKNAPKVVLGFPVSEWGGRSTAAVATFMNRVGAGNADLIIFPTLDRDAGCFEQQPQPAQCKRSGSGWYWDESNLSHPNFQDHFAMVAAYRAAVGGLPVLWWQTPLGVASNTAGGSAGHYRDNRVQYFLSHAQELVAAGGIGAVFSAGASTQTDITADGGQFQSLSSHYLASPALLH